VDRERGVAALAVEVFLTDGVVQGPDEVRVVAVDYLQVDRGKGGGGGGGGGGEK
jgi:hypothetical protein